MTGACPKLHTEAAMMSSIPFAPPLYLFSPSPSPSSPRYVPRRSARHPQPLTGHSHLSSNFNSGLRCSARPCTASACRIDIYLPRVSLSDNISPPLTSTLPTSRINLPTWRMRSLRSCVCSPFSHPRRPAHKIGSSSAGH